MSRIGDSHTVTADPERVPQYDSEDMILQCSPHMRGVDSREASCNQRYLSDGSRAKREVRQVDGHSGGPWREREAWSKEMCRRRGGIAQREQL